MSSLAHDKHDAVARAINEVEMVAESELWSDERSTPISFYRWQRPGSHVASELLYHLQELGYDVVKRDSNESVLS